MIIRVTMNKLCIIALVFLLVRAGGGPDHYPAGPVPQTTDWYPGDLEYCAGRAPLIIGRYPREIPGC